MPKYIAFLRAINVGGHTVKMDYLRSLFTGLGLRNVETFIASGNVIFDSPSKSSRTLEKKIETCLLKALGYEVTTFVRSTTELVDIAQHKPFPDSELSGPVHVVYIGFMASEPSDAAKKKLLEDEASNSIPSANTLELTNQPDWASSSAPLVAEFKVKIDGWASNAGRKVMLPASGPSIFD